jgi:hypothetical protein
MKKLNLLLVLGILLTQVAYNQITFYTQLDDGNYHAPADILIKSDGNILFCSPFYLEGEVGNTLICEVNNYGEIVNEWTYINNGLESLVGRRMIELGDHIFLFGDGLQNQSGIYKKFVSMRKFDLQFNELEKFSYHVDGINPGRLVPGRVQYRDSIFHVVGSAQTSARETPIYLKISNTGSQLHSAYYSSSVQVDMWPQDFYISPGSGNLNIICHDWFSPTWAHLYEFDTGMSIVSDLPINMNGSGMAMLGYKVFKESDSTFFLAYNFWDLDEKSSMVSRFDMDGNSLNEFKFECHEDSASWIAHLNGMDTLQDGNLLLCTTWNMKNGWSILQGSTKIVLFKLRPTLELIWQRFLFGEEGGYEAYGVKAHSDGGFVVLGTYNPTPPTNPDIKEVFLMKTDSEGLLTGINENKQQIKTTEAILYPNPASDILNIEFSQVYQNATFQLMDIGGKIVLEKQLNSNFQSINITAIPAGTYVYRIFNEDGLDERGKVVVE